MTARRDIPLASLLVTLPVTFQNVLEAINANTLGIVFIVDDNRRLIGALTDGDARRDLLQGAKLTDLITVDSTYFNKSPKFLPVDCEIAEIWKLFEQEVRCIPLLDASHRVVDFSTRARTRQFMVLQPDIGDEEISNVLECVTTGWISSQGRFIGVFEESFRDYLGGGHALAVSNGTVALHLALTALGVGPGDEVIVPNFTFGASVNAIIHAGATPVLADVHPETWTIHVNEFKKLINARTRAVMPVHIYGQPAHIDEIIEVANDNDIPIVGTSASMPALGAVASYGVNPYRELRMLQFFR